MRAVRHTKYTQKNRLYYFIIDTTQYTYIKLDADPTNSTLGGIG
jgi:hypothetical protein